MKITPTPVKKYCYLIVYHSKLCPHPIFFSLEHNEATHAGSEGEVDEGARGHGGHQGQTAGKEDGVEPAVLAGPSTHIIVMVVLI